MHSARWLTRTLLLPAAALLFACIEVTDPDVSPEDGSVARDGLVRRDGSAPRPRDGSAPRDGPPDGGVSSDGSAILPQAREQLAHATALPPELACGAIGVSRGAADWVPVRRATVFITPGEKILLQGRYRYESSAHAAVGSTVKFTIEGPGTVPFSPQNGENHQGVCPRLGGSDYQCEATQYGGTGSSVVIDSSYLFEVPAGGNYTITLSARAYSTASDTAVATACPSAWPRCVQPGRTQRQTCRLTIGTDSHLDVWRVHGGSVESRGRGDVQVNRGASATFLARSYVVPSGTDRVDISSTFGTTSDNSFSQSTPTLFKARLAVRRNGGAPVYFPSAAGRSYAVYKEKHHKVVNLSGSVEDLSPGDTLHVSAELYDIQNGPWVDVDLGPQGSEFQQGNLIIVPHAAGAP